VTTEKLIFQYESYEQKESHISMVPHRIPDNRRITKEWNLDQIREIQLRRYILRKTALEIFLLDGSSIFLNFPNGGQEEISQKLIR